MMCSLGGGEGDAEDVMKHSFFADRIDFQDLHDKKVFRNRLIITTDHINYQS